MSASKIDFTGQVVIVTGAGRGLGAAYARDLARRGAAVIVNDIGRTVDGESTAVATARSIEDIGGRARASESDVVSRSGAIDLIESALENFGRIDGIVNNAGFLRPAFVEKMTQAQVDEVVDVHLKAAFHTTTAIWPHLVANGGGSIIYTGSSATFGHEGNSNYAAAKSSILGLTRSIAAEGAPHSIRVNCVLPFAQSLIAVDNPVEGAAMAHAREALDFLSERRTPESVAPLVTYLMSGGCEVTGEIFSALAGRYARVLISLTEGWVADRVSDVRAEDIAAHLSEIRAERGFFSPVSMADEVDEVGHRLKRLGLV